MTFSGLFWRSFHTRLSSNPLANSSITPIIKFRYAHFSSRCFKDNAISCISSKASTFPLAISHSVSLTESLIFSNVSVTAMAEKRCASSFAPSTAFNHNESFNEVSFPPPPLYLVSPPLANSHYSIGSAVIGLCWNVGSSFSAAAIASGKRR